MTRPLRLGFPVKVIGRPDVKSNDTRRRQQGPHLKTSLEYVDAIFESLKGERLDMDRFAPDVAARFGIFPEQAEALARDEAQLEAGVGADEDADVDEGMLEAAE